MQEKLIKLLKKDARLSNEELAVMLGVSPKDVSDEIEELEKSGTIRGYTAILDENQLHDNSVTAIIEVKVVPEAKHGYKSVAKIIAKFPEVESVYLMSGDYDLAVTVRGADLKQVALFVSMQLSTIRGVESTATHFVIGYYKNFGEEFDFDNDERGMVSP
ncbi:MAG: Lrp/AsnC family transcriptional regulator [Oscillospiraceae bacterium]|nr:Lrp/AsnC family transcriptional regulator [Oscillospiraceae bacterium]